MIESEGKPAPRKIGVGKASVFPGFCSKHDTTLFKPIAQETAVLEFRLGPPLAPAAA